MEGQGRRDDQSAGVRVSYLVGLALVICILPVGWQVPTRRMQTASRGASTAHRDIEVPII